MSTFIEATAKAWLTALAFIAPAVNHRPASPALSNVHISPRMGQLTGHDYEVRAVANLTEWTFQGSPFLVHYRSLVEAIKTATKSDRNALVRVTPGRNAEDGTHVIAEAAGYRLSLPSVPITEWPKTANLETTGTIKPDGRDLKAAIQRVIFAASKDDTLPILTTIKFEREHGVLRLLTTDRYRLGMASMPMPRRSKPHQFLIKAKFAAHLARRISVTEPVRIDILNKGESVRFNLPGGSLATLATDGDYPNIITLFQDRQAETFDIDRTALLDATRVAASMAERNTPVQMDFTSTGVTLRFGNGYSGESSSPHINGTGTNDLCVAFNPHYLVEALASTPGDTVRFGFTTVTKPAQITDASEQDNPANKHLIMPVRTPNRAHS